MNQLNQNIIRNRDCLKCYKIEKKLPEKWKHFQDIIFGSRIFTVLENKHIEIEQIKPMFAVGSLDGYFRHIHPANPTIYYQNNYKIIEWEKSAEPRKIIGYNSFIIGGLIKNQSEYYLFELKTEKEWENILEFYRSLFNKNQLTFEKMEHIQEFLKEIQPNKLISERNYQPNIIDEKWIEKQNEVRDLTNELKETRNRYDKVCDLCFKLIEKILAEKGTENNFPWKKIERIKLLLETLAVPTSAILLIIDFFKRKNSVGS